MKKALSLVLAVTMIVMTFIMTGCIRTQSTLIFNADNTCDVSYTIAVLSDMLVDQETGEKAELFSEETLEAFKEIGLEAEKYSEDGYEGYTFSSKSDMTDETSAVGAFGQDPMFFIEGDKVVFCAPMLANQNEEEIADTAMMMELFGGFGMITIEYPFEPIETNATTVSEDGKTLTWNILDGGTAYAEFALEDFTNAGLTTEYMTVNPFEDVAYGTYYHDAVLWAYESGITTGTTATKFAPDATCTRGQVVTFLWRAMGEPEPETTENPFTDVAESDYFYKAVLWAVENEITTGTSATKFSPEVTCTNAHILTFLWRTLGGTIDESEKTEDGEWYTDAVNWAEYSGLLDGIYEGEFDPTADCPRSDVVTFLYRTLNISNTDYMTAMFEEAIYGALGEEVEEEAGEVEVPEGTLLIIDDKALNSDDITFSDESAQLPLLFVLEELGCEVKREGNAAHIKANGADYTLDFEKETLIKNDNPDEDLLTLVTDYDEYFCCFADSDVVVDIYTLGNIIYIMDFSTLIRFDPEKQLVIITSI